MEHTYEIMELAGSSKTSMEDAVANAIGKAGKKIQKPALVRGRGNPGVYRGRQGQFLAGDCQDRGNAEVAGSKAEGDSRDPPTSSRVGSLKDDARF